MHLELSSLQLLRLLSFKGDHLLPTCPREVKTPQPHATLSCKRGICLNLQNAHENSPTSAIGEYRQYRVHYVGAILPMLSVLGYWAIILGILELQVEPERRRQLEQSSSMEARLR